MLNFKLNWQWWFVGCSVLVLFVCSSARHLLFCSSAFDLGIFDQAVYLISQGETPFSTLRELHILGDHAAWILYPVAILYKIYPTVYWLFAVQAVSLALGVLPVCKLAKDAGLREAGAVVVALVYLLYPVLFNVNLLDFHPEVMSVAPLLAAIWCAFHNRFFWFGFYLVLILGCKEVMSLTIFSIGLWLLIFEKKRLCGVVAIFLGISWLIISTKVVIPYFNSVEPSGIELYSYLGNSVFDIAKNIFLKPQLILSKVFSLDTLEYLALLLAPVIWGISPKHLSKLIGAVPSLTMNILSNSDLQRNLVNQYSLPIVPFLVLVVIYSLASGKTWLRNRHQIVIFSVIAFLALAKYGYFWSIYLKSIDNWQATREAVSQVKTSGSVYTTSEISPHLTHRKLIKFTKKNLPPDNLNQFDYVLLNVRHPGWFSSRDFAQSLVEQLNSEPSFKLQYQRDEVYLFTLKSR